MGAVHRSAPVYGFWELFLQSVTLIPEPEVRMLIVRVVSWPSRPQEFRKMDIDEVVEASDVEDLEQELCLREQVRCSWEWKGGPEAPTWGKPALRFRDSVERCFKASHEGTRARGRLPKSLSGDFPSTSLAKRRLATPKSYSGQKATHAPSLLANVSAQGV